MVSDLEFEFDADGNIVSAFLKVNKKICDMSLDECQEYYEDLFHLRFHLMNDEVELVKRFIE